MGRQMLKCATDLGLWALTAAVFVAAAISTVMLAQKLEHELMPVVTDFRVVRNEHIDGSIMVSGTMRKVRSCEFVQVVAYSGETRLKLELLDAGDATTRAEGVQTWGPWRLTPEKHDPLHIHAIHRCHPLWLTFTDILEDTR